jgi:exodeoxyribonuclease V alpha subunit
LPEATRGPGAVPAAGEEAIAGLVERVAFHNEENGFAVLRVKARGHRDLVAVVGHVPQIAAGEWIAATGGWVNDRVHGQQFRARTIEAKRPTTLEGIEKYLGSGAIAGIGPVYAKKLVAAFGDKVLDTIESAPERLRQVDGIGRVRARRIAAGWAEQRAVRDIMVFLHGHGIGAARAARIYKTYGADSIRVMTENPYRLAQEIRGFGFATADEIATRLGVERTAMVRLRAGIGHALGEAMNDGHCGLPVAELVPLAERLLGVPGELVSQALELELAGGTVVADTVGGTPCVFLTALERAEHAIAGRIRALAAAPLPWRPIDAAKALGWNEAHAKIALAEGQRQAIARALESKVMVITGGPASARQPSSTASCASSRRKK